MELPQNPTTLITSTSTSYDSNFIDHLFHPPIEEDENSEWLSVFVEDCFSTPGNFVIPSTNHPIITKLTNPIPSETLKPDLNNLTRVWKKKRSVMKVKAHKTASIFGPAHFKLGLDLWTNLDPPLLHQSHWLADSELISPTKHEQSSLKGFSDETVSSSDEKKEKASVNTRRWTHCQADSELISPTKHEQSSLKGFSDGNVSSSDEKKKKASVNTTRRCAHCQADKTPLWRQGPSGKGTLCNACGVRWLKTGALFPEYRPANSPTFVRDLHSNVLRKVLKMREARLSSSSGLSDE